MQGGGVKKNVKMPKSPSRSGEGLFGDQNIHAVLMGRTSALTIENFFFEAMKFPIGIEHCEFTRAPGIGGCFFVRRRGDEWLVNERVQGVNAAGCGVHLIAGEDFGAKVFGNIVKHARGEDDIVFAIGPEVQQIGAEKIQMNA